MSNKNHNNRQINSTSEISISDDVEKPIATSEIETAVDSPSYDTTESTPDVNNTQNDIEENKEKSFQEPKRDIESNPVASVVESEKTPQNNSVIKEGITVMLKQSTKTTVTGTIIPDYAYKNIYKVKKVLPRRIIIKAGMYEIAVSKDDVVIQ